MNKLCCLMGMFIICRLCEGQSFINASFESWGNPAYCDTNLVPDNWLSYTTNGIDPDECNFLYCPTSIPPSASNGNVYARCYGASNGGEGMFQNVSGFAIGDFYQLRFDYSGSNLFGGTSDIQWHLYIDDIDVQQTPVFQSAVSIWSTFNYYFTATASTHKIGVRLISVTTTVGSGAIDNLTLSNTTGINNNSADLNFLISPNPFHNILNIAINNNLDAEIILYDISSRKIFDQSFTNSISVNTEQLAKGIYIFEVRNKNGVIKKGKLLKD